MSQWTHVNGCIRIDGIPCIDENVSREGIQKILGNACDYNSPEEAWNICNVPCGSEGSIQYALVEAGGGLVLWTVPVWGDLRNFGAGDVQEIKDWFDKVTKKSGLSIRSAILEIDVEYGETIILRYEEADHD
jgi:hypothetical protein